MIMRHKDPASTLRGHCAVSTRCLKSVATSLVPFSPKYIPVALIPVLLYGEYPPNNDPGPIMNDPPFVTAVVAQSFPTETLKSRRLSPFDPRAGGSKPLPLPSRIFHQTKNNVSSGNNGWLLRDSYFHGNRRIISFHLHLHPEIELGENRGRGHGEIRSNSNCFLYVSKARGRDSRDGKVIVSLNNRQIWSPFRVL